VARFYSALVTTVTSKCHTGRMDPELQNELDKVELAHLAERVAGLAAAAELAGHHDLAASFRMTAVDWLAEASDDQLEYCLLD
jgi:hypothetical protein